MVKEWVTESCCIGFRTSKGLMLDFDNMTQRKAGRLAHALMKRYKLEGYLLIKSSDKNNMIVFITSLNLQTGRLFVY